MTMNDEIIECADIDAWFAMGETGAFGLQYVAQQRAIEDANKRAVQEMHQVGPDVPACDAGED